MEGISTSVPQLGYDCTTCTVSGTGLPLRRRPRILYAGQVVVEERARFGQPPRVEIVDDAARRVAEYTVVQFVLGFQHALKRQGVDPAALCEYLDGANGSARGELLDERVTPLAQVSVAGERQPAFRRDGRQGCAGVSCQACLISAVAPGAEHVVQEEPVVKGAPAGVRPEYGLEDVAHPHHVEQQMHDVTGEEGSLRGRQPAWLAPVGMGLEHHLIKSQKKTS